MMQRVMEFTKVFGSCLGRDKKRLFIARALLDYIQLYFYFPHNSYYRAVLSSLIFHYLVYYKK